MRVVLQRVAWARVRVGEEIVGEIGRGLLLLVAVEKGDAPDAVAWMEKKVAEVRIFPDKEGKMNRSLEEVRGEILAVSQFTLAARIRKGRRPSFADAEEPGLAKERFQEFVSLLRGRGLGVEEGKFGAMMDVELLNQGPVTLVLER